MERRKQNVQNYGSSWIKPPGIFKSLHQLREERREMEEHQEALRRERLAQELAEAEAGGELLQGEGGDGEIETARDLDDDIPEAETTGIGEEGSENEEVENDTEAAPRGVLTQRMPDEAYREALVQGEEALGRRFAGDGGSDTDADDQSQMLQEEDLVHENGPRPAVDLEMGMDMEADLDDDVPDAEHGEYEHTDTETELSTSDEESIDMQRWPQGRALNTSMVRSDGTQNSLELSSIDLSGDVRSSPRPRAGSGRYQRRQN
jgi:Apc15p protein